MAAERVGAYPMLRKKSPLPGFLPARVFTLSGEGESPPTGFKKNAPSSEITHIQGISYQRRGWVSSPRCSIIFQREDGSTPSESSRREDSFTFGKTEDVISFIRSVLIRSIISATSISSGSPPRRASISWR